VRENQAAAEMGPPPTLDQEMKWMALAFIPSSLMLGVTTALTNDLAPIPLLWVIPLGLYLLSFILVFARKPMSFHFTVVETLPILLLVVAFPIALKAVLSPGYAILYLIILFFACMACHGELAIDRPSTTYLTRFYLCVSVGGVLGGLFNAIVAPLVFKSVLELPIALFLLALAIPLLCSHHRKVSINKLDFILPAALGMGVAFLALLSRSTTFRASALMSSLVFAVPLLVCFSFSSRPLRFALGFGSLLLASGLYAGPSGRMLLTQRSFFGVYRVSEAGGYRVLIHGNTMHGIQSMDPGRDREPLSYYSETVSLEIPGMLINGKAALRDQFVRPFVAGFPGNRHITKNMIFGEDVVVVEWSFEADHSGPFAGRAATGSAVKLPGCGVYEFDPANRQITAARIYFDVTTLLKQISSHQPQVLQDLLISWFASRACSNEKASMDAGGYLKSVSGRM